MNKKCLTCKKLFEKKVKESKLEWNKKKFCSYSCYWKSKLGSVPWNKNKICPQMGVKRLGTKLNKEWIKNLSESHKGKKQSKETIEKRMKSIRREKHYAWKGDDVGYGALHIWVKKELGQPTTCEHCKKSDLKGMKIHWANKTGLYKRNKKDWLRLCVSCHRQYDFKHKITMKKYA